MIYKTKEMIRKELFAHIESVQSDYVAKGFLPQKINLNAGVIRGLLEIFIWGIHELYAFLDLILKQAFPATSTGKWLDLHVNSVEIKRKEATKAIGNVEFFRLPNFNGAIHIPAGKIVRTTTDGFGKQYRYVTLEDATMLEHQDRLKVTVESEEYGSKPNVYPGAITQMVTPIKGIEAVNNSADWLTVEGSDVESDAKLLYRYQLQWRSISGITSAAYELSALSVAGVREVKILDRHPRGQGTVDIVVMGENGVPTEDLIKKVNSVVEDKIIINHDLKVYPVKPVKIKLKAVVEYLYGNEIIIASKVRSLIYEKLVELRIGSDLILNKLITEALKVDGVKRITFITPQKDVEISSYEYVVLEDVSVFTEAVKDE